MQEFNFQYLIHLLDPSPIGIMNFIIYCAISSSKSFEFLHNSVFVIICVTVVCPCLTTKATLLSKEETCFAD
jgi:hypothetical protein